MLKFTIYNAISVFAFTALIVSCGAEETKKSTANVGEETKKTEHWDNGKIKEELISLGDNKTIERKYYENGKKKSETEYTNGIRDGKQFYWYENGVMGDSSFFKNDKLQSLLQRYENGQISARFEVISHESYSVYDSKDKLDYTASYIFGNTKSYSQDGKLTEMTKISGDTAFFYKRDDKDSLIKYEFHVRKK